MELMRMKQKKRLFGLKTDELIDANEGWIRLESWIDDFSYFHEITGWKEEPSDVRRWLMMKRHYYELRSMSIGKWETEGFCVGGIDIDMIVTSYLFVKWETLVN